jgi:hypothetical protein
MAVKSVYRGSDYFEAQLLKGIMEQEGRQVFLQGAALQGAMGEVPAMGHLSIDVNDTDQDRATEIIAAYERGDYALDEGLDDALDNQKDNQKDNQNDNQRDDK